MPYGPAAVVESECAGIAQECRDMGLEPVDYDFALRWITIDNKPIASLEILLLLPTYPQ